MQNNGYYPELMDGGASAQKQKSNKPKPKFSVYTIVLGVEVALIVCLMIAIVVARNNKSGNDVGVSAANQVLVEFCGEHGTKNSIIDFTKNISKEEALDVVKQLNSNEDCIPGGLVPNELELRPGEFGYKMLYSYDNLDDVASIAENSVMGVDKTIDDFVIEGVKDQYAMVSVDDSKVDCGGLDKRDAEIICYRGVSFNTEYLDYHEMDEDIVVNDLSSDFAKLSLGVGLVSDDWSRRSLYDYYFEDLDDKYVMTGVYFGVGANFNEAEDGSANEDEYAVNIGEKKIAIDKTTKAMYWEKNVSENGGESFTTIVKSIPLSNDELLDLSAEIDGLSDEEKKAAKERSRSDDEMTDSQRLGARAAAICEGDYTEIYKSSDNAGIFQCDDGTGAIYAIENPERTVEGYNNVAYASYLGTNDDEIASRYFGDDLYILQDYLRSDIPLHLIVLTKSPSESGLVEQKIDAIYDYVKAVSEKDERKIVLSVFYNEDVDQIKTLKDYVVLPAASGYYAWLPKGDEFGKYYYQADADSDALRGLADDPDSYSGQTRNAIKSNRRIEAVIGNGKEITKDALRTILYDSFAERL